MAPEEVLSQTQEWETVPSFELEEASRDQLHKFRATFARAGENPIAVFGEDLFDVESYMSEGSPDKPINERIAAEIKDRMVYSGNEFYTTEEFDWLPASGLDRFDVVRSAKAETSAHGVFFGVMTSSQTDDSLPVAVKPCTENPKKAYLDWLNNNLVARTGRKNFIPIGFIFDEDRAYSITRIERGVETLDNTEWNNVLMDPESQQYEGQREELAELGRELAGLHQDKIFHGDPQFKNIAVDPAGKIFFIDWESAQFFGDNASSQVLNKKAAHDLEILYYSAAAPEARKGVGLLSAYSPELQWCYFNKFILTPYLEARLEADDSAENVEAVAETEDQIKNYVLKEFTAGSVKRYLNSQQNPKG